MASVLDAIKEAVGEAFVELASVAQAVGYRTAAAATYNTTTGDVTKPVVTFSINAFVDGYKHREIDGQHVRIGDKRLLVEKAKATTAAVAAGTTFGPKLDDKVLIGGVEHLVVFWQTDPAEATVEIQVRRAV